LEAEGRRMRPAARIREDVGRAFQALGPEGADGLMGDAVRWLDAAAPKAEGLLAEPLAALGRALTELGEASQGVERALEGLDHDPRHLEAGEDRLFPIRAAAAQHAGAADDRGAFAAAMRGQHRLLVA